jgi:hypothetical protein
MDARVHAELILSILRPLTEEQRISVLMRVFDVVCEHCGREQPEGCGRCQCWNDE